MPDLQSPSSRRLIPVRKALGAARHALGIAARKTWVVLRRLPIASYSFARALADADYARTLTDIYVDGASSPVASPAAASPLPTPAAPATPTPPPPAAVLQKGPPDSALVLLGLLQNEGRFVDFLQEDITCYSDQEIGAAARVVHQGCQRVLRENLTIAPVRDEAEGTRITLPKGFDPAAIRPTGNVVGEPPFSGSLVHRGWRAAEVRLPRVASSRDVRILAPAEVEL
ncbi:DUF2760 domain-containing protein [Thiohalocapsa marina]|uniref:DUF2760 domain-containing protein n=1 Tax=Thiohalocapsa marina TaxID=424902 RepID=A0A5M8FLM6_9GAMM|nr:DUF2760 domain-containing protein [Thiohalocapsa marina]KAA6185637.1 DUF2760 domain-containing protein [Thiohalocapsa marina]